MGTRNLEDRVLMCFPFSPLNRCGLSYPFYHRADFLSIIHAP